MTAGTQIGSGKQIGRLLAITALVGGAVPAYAHHVEKHFAVGSHPVVAVHNANGNITIHSWQKPEVQVIGDHASNKVEVDAVQLGNRVEVETHVLSENVGPEDLTATYEIMVPEETALQVHNDSGLVQVDHVLGDATYETVAAVVQLQSVAGSVRVKTVGGSFTCVECAGRIEANSISGNVSILRAESGYVHVQTSAGNILLDSDLLPNGIYHLHNVSGQIEMRFSLADSFDVKAVSYKGTVENEANLKPHRHISRRVPQGLKTSLFGTYNEGKAQVELTSFSGKIEIRKRQ